MKLCPEIDESCPAQSDSLAIAVRAFAPPPKKTQKRWGKPGPASVWTLVFDTETTTDSAQRLRIGAFQLRKRNGLVEAGVFYEPAAVDAEEQNLLRRYAAENGCTLRTVAEFIDEVLYDRAYDLRPSIVGFNLPFDISRLAVSHGSARGKVVRGGFTFKLSEQRWRPAIQIRHLNARASLIQFTHPGRPRDTPSQRDRKIKPKERRGSFIDLKTIAAALLSRSFNLASLADFLKTPTQKAESGGHGRRLTPEYIRYALQDVQASWECYQVLRDRYALHSLEETQMGKILSEASLGKAYLRQMGIRPFSEVEPDFPAHIIGRIMSAYFGGRAEVRWRRIIRQVLYCDFLSMYPTVCTLMGLWRFVIGQGMEWRDSTAETRALIESILLDDLQRPECWLQLTTLVRVKPQANVLPVRAKYDGRTQTIGLNYLSSDQPLWFTLADVIASKLLSGQTPEIIEVITFSPKEPQEGLSAVLIAGNPKYRVDPTKDDFFKRLIDLRSAVKARLKNSTALGREALESEQLALKILANSTSYGIFVEIIVADAAEPQSLTCYGPNGEGFRGESNKVEEPGRYFHPLLATLITGAARLMLAAAETLCLEKGLDWAFCDTDSLAIAKPAGVGRSEFYSQAQSVCEWFSPLNPYEKKGPIFKIEDANRPIVREAGGLELEALHCYCISAKRYALFNVGTSGEIIIRKASAHGLGHYLPPYEAGDVPQSIPAPTISLDAIGLERWHYDLWHTIIRAALEGHPDLVDLSYHSALQQPAASRYGASTPALLKWFAEFNSEHKYPDSVKPFNFLIAFQARPQFELPADQHEAVRKRGRPRKQSEIKPVAPFSRDIRAAAKTAFDRETAISISADQLMTYAEALAWYHLRPEAKFLNGDFCDRGRTERRRVIATQILHVGKEANKWEEQYFLGADDDAEIEYGVDQSVDELVDGLRELCRRHGERETARHLQISRTALRKVLKAGVRNSSPQIRKRLAQALSAL